MVGFSVGSRVAVLSTVLEPSVSLSDTGHCAVNEIATPDSLVQVNAFLVRILNGIACFSIVHSELFAAITVVPSNVSDAIQ